MKHKPIFLAALALTLPLAGVMAQPVVPSATTTKYATVLGPRELSFGADGALYTGCDLSGTGGGGPADAVKIHRIGPGGSPVTEYGNVAIPDPDAVIVDRTGAISGIAGAVLVGGQTSPGIGQVARVALDGTVTALFGPSSLYNNPSAFAYDSLGRLLFTESAQGRIYRCDGGAPVLLFNLGDAYSIAVDATNRIVVSPANNPGRLMLYSASGSLANANFATVVPASPLARGPGGMWTTDVYAITDGGDLVRIALDGTTNTMGSGFGNIEGMTFGPDGALYASDFPNARVWRIAPQPQQWSTNNLPSGLIAWWQAEGNMLDSAGPHHGTGSTAPTYGPGRFGRAFQFNGTDQSLAIPNSYSDLDGWTQFTLEAWFNLDSTSDRSGGQAIFSKVGNVSDHVNYNQGYQFTLANNASRVDLQFNTNGQAWPGFSTRVNLGAPLLTNTWYHLVGTYDHNAVKIYLNSVPLVTNVVGPATIRNSSSTLRISKDDNLNVLFAGRIDDARIYNRALTVAEIASLCAGPNPPLTRPVLKHTPKGDGKFTFEWDSISNQTYHVESATNLVNPRWQPVGWQPVGDSIIATNTATSISYPIGGEIQRFYRVVTP